MNLKSRREAIDTLELKRHSLSREEKRKIIQLIKREIKKDKRIAFAYLYGSFVRERSFHDIDIAFFIKDFNEKDWRYYELELSNKIESLLHFKYPVECRILNDAEIFFAYRAIQGRIIDIKERDLWSDYVIKTLKSYADFYPFWYSYFMEALKEDAKS